MKNAFSQQPPIPFQYGHWKEDMVIRSHYAACEIKKAFATRDPRVFKKAPEFEELFLRYDAFEVDRRFTLCALFAILAFHLGNASKASRSADVCQWTPNPSFCRATLHNLAIRDTRYHSRYLLGRSVSQARKFLALAEKEAVFARRESSLPNTSVRALEDCQDLTFLSFNHLLTVSRIVGKNENTSGVDTEQLKEAQALLSAVLMSQQTCADTFSSLKESSPTYRGMLERVDADTELYRLLLSVFSEAWINRAGGDHRGHQWGLPKWKRLALFKDDPVLPMKLAGSHAGMANESISGMKLIEVSVGDDDEGKIMVGDIVVVSKDGSGKFTTITKAISAAPKHRQEKDGYFMIYVKAGVYNEYLNIDARMSYIMIVGDGINQTVITGSRCGSDGWRTFGTSTVAVSGPYFIGMNLTVRNTAGLNRGQAVALTSVSDQSTFYRCSFVGYQDTLYTHSNTQVFRECDIYGSTDFIFGNAGVLFDRCNIYSQNPRGNIITAQGREQINQNTGTFIYNSTIRATHKPSSKRNGSPTYLGRPWRKYSRAVIMNTYMDSSIRPQGWQKWNRNTTVDTLYYAEYNNSGPGSSTRHRVKWKGFHLWSEEEATEFLRSSFPKIYTKLG
ncbi:hypothetical protein MLD38_026800 [Melastoma candidum]|uniref:Uncharacterized protein n=1 Tax=Melastoma candidum TaxID=119954 RepID=A0ACB9P364_9MYRT|nr:hypothetical protein MLD38_026800 [Melastoma candidum]